MNYNKLSNMAGRSMIEMLGVLAIIGVLSVGGIAAFSQMLSRYKITQTYEQINAIAAKLSAVGSEAASYDGLDNKAAIKFGAIPKEAIVDAEEGTLENLFKGEIQIIPGQFNSNVASMSYIIVYSNLPKDACMHLATQDWGRKGSSFLNMIIMNTTKTSKIKDFQGWIKLFSTGGSNSATNTAISLWLAKDMPMTPVAATKNCSQCEKKNCTLAFTFN